MDVGGEAGGDARRFRERSLYILRLLPLEEFDGFGLHLGKVQMGSGDSFSLDLYGDGLINLQASPAITQQLVSNSGTIQANGGKVLLTTAAAENAVNSLINMNGIIQANSVGRHKGKITLYAKGSKGDINLSGSIKANGGKVRIIAGNQTNFSGTIEAKGGSQSGNGGYVETSGNSLNASGHVDASAPHGEAGTWLLDPTTINVITGGGASLTGSTIDPSDIVTALNGTNVTLTADTSITVTNVINASGNGSAGNLILDASADYLNAPITLKTGSALSGTASTVNVGASGLIQNGVDAAAASGTVNLAESTYALSNEVTIGKSLTLNGNGATLNGQNSTHVMEIDGTNSGITVNLNDMTLEHGNGAGTNESTWGGGLLIYTEGGNKAIVTLSPQEADAYQSATLITAPLGTAAPAAPVVIAPPPPSPVVIAPPPPSPVVTAASPPPNPASVSQALQIYIHRNGQPFGPYSEHDIRRYLAQGRLRPTDPAWHNGVTTWVPVSTVLQLSQSPLRPA